MLRTLIWVLVLSIPFTSVLFADTATFIDTEHNVVVKKLSPKAIHFILNKEIVKHLQYQHYEQRKLDDVLSNQIFEQFIKRLDTAKMYFLASDIKEFEQHRYHFDEYLKEEKLQPAYNIFNRYQQRNAERIQYLLVLLEQGLDKLDFTKDETLESDPDKRTWMKNKKELDDLWRKRLKNIVISMKIDGDTLEKIQKSLQQRYHYRLKRLMQTKSEDAFRIYINTLGYVYDPHTQYYSPRLSENFNIKMRLSLEGIGAVLQLEDEYTKVVRLVPAGPADKAGQLKAGDKIIAVGQGDDKLVDVVGWRLDDVVALIRGDKKTVVKLKILPEGKEGSRLITIVRDTVKLEEQAAKKKMFEIIQNHQRYKIGIIDLPTFYIDFKGAQAGKKDYKSTTRDVRKLIRELQYEQVDGIIIDLRDNGGGALREAAELTGLFIKKGPVVQIRNAYNQVNTLVDDDNEVTYDGPLLVLVNRLSASASEIFAGAIQDYNRGLILGNSTFGKGTVQALQPLRQGQLKLTHAKFYRISGESTQLKGVTPDILYPARYNEKEIGEQALEDALPWDTIDAAEHKDFKPLDPIILSKIKKRHDRRTKISPDFIYLKETMDYIEDLKKDTLVSLREDIRKKEYEENQEWQLDTENKRRRNKGLAVFKNYAELKEYNEKEEKEQKSTIGEKKKIEDDVYLSESAKILVDMLELNHSKFPALTQSLH